MSATRRHANPVEELVFQCQAAKLPTPEREVQFDPERRWRADLMFEDETHDGRFDALLVEVEGGVWLDGRHVRGAGFEADCEKYAHAMMLGYRVLRVTPRHIRSGQALSWIEALLK